MRQWLWIGIAVGAISAAFLTGLLVGIARAREEGMTLTLTTDAEDRRCLDLLIDHVVPDGFQTPSSTPSQH